MSMSIPLKMHNASEKKETEAAANEAKTHHRASQPAHSGA